jgi:GMP synthase-like glutamine amidotransferase
MRIHCLQHVPFEGPAGVADWAVRKGHPIRSTAVYEGKPLPDDSDFDWLFIMGGPMGVYDEAEHPWLSEEKAFLRATIEAGKTVIGICLGAQLIADALGARVVRNAHKEIGWFPIELTSEGRSSPVFGFLPERFEVFHWHGDTFELPRGAFGLARSVGCANQAFLYRERVLGLQFHLESTPASVATIVRSCADEIVAGPYIQTGDRMLAATDEDYRRIHDALSGILDRLPT